MSAGWETKTLGEILQKTENVNPAKKPDDGFIYIDVSSVSRDTYSIDNPQILKGHEAPSRARKLVKANDVIFATIRPTLQRISVVPEKYNNQVCSTGFYVLRPKDCVDYSYLFYYLLTNSFNEKMEILQKGASYPAVTNKEVEAQSISYPKSLEEQRRIVAVLDEALAGVQQATANTERNLANTQELFDAHLQAIFANPAADWEVCAIEDYVNFIDYRGKTPKKTQSGLRLITAKNVKPGVLQREPEEFVNPDTYDSWMTRGIPNKGDVLFTTEAPLGNVAQLDTDDKVVLAQRIITMQPQADKIDQTFLKYLLMSQPIQQKILEKGTGATVKGIKSKLLKKIEIYFPKSLDEQRRIVAQLDDLAAETQRLQAIYRQKLAALQELKQSILQQAFSGQLTQSATHL